MSSLEELNRKIDALEQEIVANKAKVDAGTFSEAERVAIRQQISTDTTLLTTLSTRLTALEERRETQLQQQQQAGRCLFVPDEFIAAVFLQEMCSVRKSLTCLFLFVVLYLRSCRSACTLMQTQRE